MNVRCYYLKLDCQVFLVARSWKREATPLSPVIKISKRDIDLTVKASQHFIQLYSFLKERNVLFEFNGV